MGQHVEFATGNLRSLEARHNSKRLWGELTKILNNCRTGTRKTSDGWSKYWSDFKNKLKNKVSILKKRKRSGSPSKKGMRPLTKLEKRALVILGPHFGRKKTRSTVVAYSNELSNHLPSEVKLEAYQENASSEFCTTQSEGSDRFSDGDKDSEESANSNNEYDDDSDQNSNEPLIQNLYPKWLIDIEKKRADAELIRAKAEEQRVGVAAKSAEAMLIQAEALRKLSEAAATQADAIRRIAVVLENRSHRDDILSI
ncbi:unnamed protein product [Parnassius apollo]|uniref:(apollo) hypothetical protein n=1 Tax=Parnassius apollo TaxID=110799 RepID=A0A8S3XTE1_PARAO|nr:unnamed protein product [Parnassius apollo]